MARFGVVLSLVCVLTFVPTVAQTNYVPVGIPQNSATIPIPLGFIDPLSSQVHLEIPIASVPQRNAPPSTAMLVYDPTFCYYLAGNWPCGYGAGWQLKTAPISSSSPATGVLNWTTSVSYFCPDPSYPYGQVTNFQDISVKDSPDELTPKFNVLD